MAEAVLATPPKKWAREYEVIYILRPNVEPEDAAKVADRVKQVMDRMDAKITKVDNWGKRRLAYAIQKHTRGIFVYVRFIAFGDVVAELERNLRLLETVVRYQTIVTRDQVDMDTVEIDAEEVEFAAIEKSEEEEELTRAQRLGMEDIRPRAAKDDAKTDAKDGEAKADAKDEAKTEGEAKADDGEAKADAKDGEAKADEAKADEAKADEAKADEAKTDEAVEAKADDAEATESTDDSAEKSEGSDE